MNSAEVLIKFKGDTKGADTATKKMTSSIDGLTKSFTLASLAAKGITTALSVFKSGLDDAITRVDTLNNFPKVMSNLGISTEKSAEVINDLSEKLKGLPTTIDDAAGAIQRFTSKNGDVKKSEELFLAVNNAILAGGGNTQVQTSALEQLSQAYAKGKPDMMEWRSLMTAMPAQLKQVAVAMGYTDAAMLGEAVRAKEGEAEFARMMETIVLMNKKGVAGFKSFDEQARNATGGINTSLKNMKTAFVRGIGDILQSLDKSLESVGGISGVLSSIGKVGETFFKSLGNILQEIMPILMEIGEEIMPVLKEVFDALMPPLKELTKALLPALRKLFKKLMPYIKSMIEKLMPILVKLIEALIPLLDPLVDLIGAILDVQMAILEPLMEVLNVILPPLIDILSTLIQVILPILTTLLKGVAKVFKTVFSTIGNLINKGVNVIKNLPDTIKNIFKTIKDIIVGIPETVGKIIKSVVEKLTDFITKDLPDFIGSVLQFFIDLPGNIWDAIVSAIENIGKWASDMIDKAGKVLPDVVDAIIDIFKSLPSAMANIGADMFDGLIDGFKRQYEVKWVKLKGLGLNIVSMFKNVFGIHSPSKLMKEEIGVNLGLGIEEGLLETQKTINRAISSIGNSTGTSLNQSTLGTMQSSSLNPIFNVYVESNTDPLGQTVSNIKTFGNGAKNDYNYGVGV